MDFEKFSERARGFIHPLQTAPSEAIAARARLAAAAL